MPLSSDHTNILNFILFGRLTGIDAVASEPVTNILKFLGLDEAAGVRETSPSDLSISKFRTTLDSSDKGKALLALLEVVDGQLAKLCAFLKKMQRGDIDRYLRDNKSNDIPSLKLLDEGDDSVHSFSSNWNEPAETTQATAKSLKLSDATSYRKLLAHFNINHSSISYLTEVGAQDNWTELGNQKDEHLHKVLTSVLIASNLSNSFNLVSNRMTGRSLLVKGRIFRRY